MLQSVPRRGHSLGILSKRPVVSFSRQHRHNAKPSVLARIADPGPPLLARYPLAYKTFRWFRLGILVFLVGHIAVDYFYEVSWTWGISMLPTLAADGSPVLISKYYRRGRGIEIGDLISYSHPLKAGTYAIKRVVALEGDFVVRDSPHKGAGAMIQIPRGHCYVVGDNLEHSRDSRMFGPLPLNLIKGKVICCFERVLGLVYMPVPFPETMTDAEEGDYGHSSDGV